MIDKWLSKTKFKVLVEKLGKRLFYKKISANQITVLALILGLLSALSIFLSGILIWKIELIICAAILMFISFFFDALDGALARLEKPTTFGGILDIFSDRIFARRYFISSSIFSSILMISSDFNLYNWKFHFNRIEDIEKIEEFIREVYFIKSE